MKTLLLLLTALLLPCVRADEPKKAPATPAPAADTAKPSPEKKMDTITLGAGCFWCIEAVLQRINGVTTVVSGYSNGKTENPTYEDICTGLTGYAEVVQVTYDPAVLPTEKLLHVFFELHDPTTLNRQGNDRGTQYRSGIFYHNDEQKAVAEKVKADLTKAGKFPSPIVTEITPLAKWHKGEGYHQDYFNKNYTQGTGNWGYCNATVIPKLKKLGLLKPEEKKIVEEIEKRRGGE